MPTTDFRQYVIRHAVWLILRFTLSYRMSRISWLSADLDHSLPRTYVEPGLNRTIVGISMKWWSQLLDGKCTCGVLSTAKVRFSRSA